MNYQPMYNYGIFGGRQAGVYPYQPMQNMQQPSMQQPMQPIQPVQSIQPQQVVGLQGKSVDSIEVVKAMDIPLDGTVSYFPLTDGSAIVTKQLQVDGSSKTVVYEPIEPKKVEKAPSYITAEQLDEKIKKLGDTKELKDDIKKMQRQIEDIVDDIKYFKDTKSRKD